jgi:hypothetical protein
MNWGTHHKLATNRNDISRGRAIVTFLSPDDDGLLEILYRFDSEPVRARVTMNFIDRSGRELEPSSIKKLAQKLDLDTLSTELTKALTCG